MNIDWGNAPKGFPLWLEGLGEHAKHSGWYRRSAEVFEHESHGQFRAFREGQFFVVHQKPEIEPWTGEGWPPVGIKCEMRLWPNGEWELCQPAYYLEQPIDHSDQVVVYQNSLGGDVCYVLDPPCAGSIEFRPVRTPEQIEAEERDQASFELAGILAGHDQHIAVRDIEMAKYLYDIGYRKAQP